MKYAKIELGLVTNIIDSSAVLPDDMLENHILIDGRQDTPFVGWIYNVVADRFSEAAPGIIPGDLYDNKYASFCKERNRMFTKTEWVRQRHLDYVDQGIDDSENWAAWLNYWQALRDMPAQPDFNVVNPQFPTQPE